MSSVNAKLISLKKNSTSKKILESNKQEKTQKTDLKINSKLKGNIASIQNSLSKDFYNKTDRNFLKRNGYQIKALDNFENDFNQINKSRKISDVSDNENKNNENQTSKKKDFIRDYSGKF